MSDINDGPLANPRVVHPNAFPELEIMLELEIEEGERDTALDVERSHH